MQKAIVLLGHGSQAKGANETMLQVAHAVHKHYPEYQLTCAFLEIEKPSLEEAIEHAIQKGAHTVLVVPYFLQSGKHVTQHIPEIISREKKKYPKVNIAASHYLGFHEALVTVVLARIREIDKLESAVSYD
jgi:sirohydrochlorin ferrochelatase